MSPGGGRAEASASSEFLMTGIDCATRQSACGAAKAQGDVTRGMRQLFAFSSPMMAQASRFAEAKRNSMTDWNSKRNPRDRAHRRAITVFSMEIQRSSKKIRTQYRSQAETKGIIK